MNIFKILNNKRVAYVILTLVIVFGTLIGVNNSVAGHLGKIAKEKCVSALQVATKMNKYDSVLAEELYNARQELAELYETDASARQLDRATRKLDSEFNRVRKYLMIDMTLQTTDLKEVEIYDNNYIKAGKEFTAFEKFLLLFCL